MTVAPHPHDEPQFVDLTEAPLVADEDWLTRQLYGTNGNHPASVRESWVPRDLSELAETPPVQPTLGGYSIAYPGMRHVFSGPQESAKTLAAYVVGLGEVRLGRRVVLIDFEMGAYDVRTRLRELGATNEEIRQFAYLEPTEPPTQAETASLIALEPGCVILDASAGAFAVSGLDDNRRAEVELWARAWIEPFRRAHIATITLDHVVKSAEGRGNYAIGSERKVGGADVHLGFSVQTPIRRGGHGIYRIVTHKDRGGFLRRGRLADFLLESDPDTHVISWDFQMIVSEDGDTWRPSVLMERVSRFLELKSEPVSQRTIEGAVTGKASGIREAVRYLEADGFADISDSGIVSLKAYRPDDSEVRPGASRCVPEPGAGGCVPASPPLGGTRDERSTEDEDAAQVRPITTDDF